MAKKSGEWQNETLAEFDDGNKIWKAQRLTAPVGDVLLGLKAFAKKKDGTIVATQHGFNLPLKGVTRGTFVGISKLLKTLAAEVPNG